MIRNKRLKEKLTTLINDLMMDYPAGYLILALKQISDQQLLHLNIDTKQIIRDPILKVYELTVSEL